MPTVVSRRAPRGPRLDTRRIRVIADRMLVFLEIQGAELSLLITDDPQIQELNRTHRRKNRPTDVLAFPLMNEADSMLTGGTRLLGDVVVSLDTARAQARQRGWTLEQEVVFLLAHGLLHLLGYDHKTDAQELEMTRMTKELVQAASERAASARRPSRGHAKLPSERGARRLR